MSGPGFSQSLQQRQAQQLVLAPQMRQSLKILQVAALDLRATIQEELQSNPALEELPMEGVSIDKSTAESAEQGGSDPEQSQTMDFGKDKDLEILGRLNDDWRDQMADSGGVRARSSEDDERRQHFFDSLTTETSLAEHLMQQAEMADGPAPVREGIRYLVGSLDDRGFLTTSLSDIALMSGLSLETVQESARVLRSFEPAGIGADSLSDCLLLQISQRTEATVSEE